MQYPPPPFRLGIAWPYHQGLIIIFSYYNYDTLCNRSEPHTKTNGAPFLILYAGIGNGPKEEHPMV